MTDVDLTATLAAIRENAVGLTLTHFDDDCEPGNACTGHEAIWMVNALEAVLKLAGAARGALSFPPADCTNACSDGPCNCSGKSRVSAWDLDPETVREAITRELTGEGNTDGR